MRTNGGLCVTISLALLLMSAGCGGSSSKPTVTGSWSGTATSTFVVGAAGVSGNLTQGVTNPDGSIQFSGTLFLTNSCITTVQLSGTIAGGAFALLGQNTDGSSLAVTATIDPHDTTITGTYTTTAGTVCSADQGTFSLAKH